jgi:hypothetical protein
MVMVSCWNKGLGMSHSVRHDSGRDRVCPDAPAAAKNSRRHVQMSFRSMRVKVLYKINYILGLQIYHFYFVSDY